VEQEDGRRVIQTIPNFEEGAAGYVLAPTNADAHTMALSLQGECGLLSSDTNRIKGSF